VHLNEGVKSIPVAILGATNPFSFPVSRGRSVLIHRISKGLVLL
jgi:hypothetical protein